MSQKPIVMEQLKQVLQLKNDGIPIREIARRTGISRNSVRKYLALLSVDVRLKQANFQISNWLIKLIKTICCRLVFYGTSSSFCIFRMPAQSCLKQVLPGSCSGTNTCFCTPMDTPIASTVFI